MSLVDIVVSKEGDPRAPEFLLYMKFEGERFQAVHFKTGEKKLRVIAMLQLLSKNIAEDENIKNDPDNIVARCPACKERFQVRI